MLGVETEGMTDVAPRTRSLPATLGFALARIWRNGRPVERTAYLVGALLFTSGLVHVAVLLVTGHTWVGPVSLRKAATFGLSFGLTLATVVWTTSFLKISTRVRSVLLTVFTVVCVVETTLVSMQAWRGVPSHFNFETPFDTVVAMALAAGGAVIILTVLGFASATIVGSREITPSTRLAVRAGFVILLVSLGIGAVMVAHGAVEARTGSAQLAYTTTGKLKPAHAVAMHGILVLPALAWLLGLTNWPERARLGLVAIATAGYAILTAVVLVESFNGVSPFAATGPETATSAVAIALLAGVTVVTAFGLLSRRRPAAD